MNTVCKLKKFPSYRQIIKFRAASSASAKQKSEPEIENLVKRNAKISQSAAGITVASIENYSPISQVSVVFKAGSRYESPSTLGASHCIRNAATLSTRYHSAFFITRHLETKGSKLNVTSTREHIIYTLQCNRDEIDSGLELLANVSTNQAFKPWEISDSSYRMHLDLALLNNNLEAVLLEALHKAAFRGGLSNSLYSPSFMIGKHNSEMLQQYMSENFTIPRTSVVGLGISHDHLQKSVNELFNLMSPFSSAEASKFGGGDVRIEMDIPYVHTAIVAEGSGLLNIKDTLSLGVLQCLLGIGARSKLGGSQFSKLGEAASKITDDPFSISCLNVNYSDTGLFGVVISGEPDSMKPLVKSVVSQMREVMKNISDKDVEVAKHQLKAKLFIEKDNSRDLSAIAIDVSTFGKIRDIKEIEKSIDELKISDITSVAAKVMKTKPAMASIGRLHSTPYLDELI